MHTILITGASTGIGRATALRLDRAGWRVVATVRRGADAAALAADSSGRLRVCYLDVTEAACIAEMAEEVEDLVGAEGLNGLVNNAGIVEAGPLECLPLDGLRRQFEVNVVGQVAVTQALLPALRRARGRIVNVGSIGGVSALPFAGAYCASKFALEAVTDALRMELKAAGVEVVLVQPGSIATPIWEKGAGQAVPPEAEARYGPQLTAMKAVVRATATTGLPPEAVAAVIHKALAARRPKTRYRVGRMAHVRLMLQRVLPDRLRDRVLLRRLTGTG